MEAWNIPLPELGSGTEAEQLRQVQHYLHSLARQLQAALQTVQHQETVSVSAPVVQASTPSQTFASIKSLIIKSADVVEAVAQSVERSLEGRYVAESQFGIFRQETEQHILETDRSVEQNFVNVQEILSRVEGIQDALMEVNAYIHTGLMYEDESGTPVYGVEIGQQTRVNEELTFRKFARLAADRLSFYDSNDREVAYISDFRLHVTEAEIYRLDTQEASAHQLNMGDYTWVAGRDGHLSLC